MKKSLLILAFAAAALNLSAKYEGPGYYRIQNYATERYLYVLDNRADIDYTASDVDMNGVELWRGEDLMISNPATVVFVAEIGSEYDIQAQGTGIYSMSGIYLKLRTPSDAPDTYMAYGSKSGMTKYLGDPEKSKRQQMSYLASSASGTYRYWYLKPMNTDDNYFGVQPTVSAGGKHYAAHYADFPFTPQSKGVTAYVVTKIDKTNAIAVVAPVTDGVVPEKTPVIIECASTTPADNKLTVSAGTNAKITANLLQGNYFDNEGEGGHYNRTANDTNTMRVLGLTKEGKIGLIKGTQPFLAGNSSYLKVSTDCPAELTIMTEEQYAQVGAIDLIPADDVAAPFDVYNTQGVRVLKGVTTISGLPAGIYIANGKKIIIR